MLKPERTNPKLIRPVLISALCLAACSADQPLAQNHAEPQTRPSGIHNECQNWRDTQPDWIWCDDFEEARSMASKYGRLSLSETAMSTSTVYAASGDHALAFHYSARADDPAHVNPGHFRRNFGRAPANAIQANRGALPHFEEDFQTVYYRYYHYLPADFVAWPNKFSRAFSVFDGGLNQWGAQAMIAHLWMSDEPGHLMIDPASSVNPGGQPVARRWNDIESMSWLNRGTNKAQTTALDALQKGRWHCIEVMVRLNDAVPQQANGVFRLWLDGREQIAEARTALDWTGPWREFGINGVQIESYWNNGSPRAQTRYVDALVISRKPIGCPHATR